MNALQKGGTKEAEKGETTSSIKQVDLYLFVDMAETQPKQVLVVA